MRSVNIKLTNISLDKLINNLLKLWQHEEHVEDFKSANTIQASSMFSSVKRPRRPLGYYVPESRVELQIEKAMFRNHAQVLRNMCDKPLKQRHTQQLVASLNLYSPSHKTPFNISKRTTPAQDVSRSMPSEIRWLLTRSAQLQRVNNPGFSKFRKSVKDRVVSANDIGGQTVLSPEKQRSMCSRYDNYSTSINQRLQCDVLGPEYCTDCTEMNSKLVIAQQQQRKFPRIEVHTRSLVAPERVEKLYLSNVKAMFNQDTRYACGCPVDPMFEITTPVVYTPHEIFERIRMKKNIEMGEELIRIEQELQRKSNNTPVPQIYSEKTELPLDLKVSVTYKSIGTDVGSIV